MAPGITPEDIFVAQEVDVHTFAAAHADGAFVIDVREPYEYVAGHVPGALLIPLDAVTLQSGDLPGGQPVYVICATGNRSLVAASWLNRLGIDARSVAGGTTAWMAAGHPVVTGTVQNAA